MKAAKAIRSLRFRYVLGLGAIALLVTGSWLTLQTVVAKQENFSKVVNIAGHQRGRAERIALFSIAMATTRDEDEYETARAQLGRAVHQLADAHHVLLHGSPEQDVPRVMTPMLKTIYFDPSAGLDPAVTRYLKHARSVYETPFGELTPNDASYVFVMQYGPHVIKTMFDFAVEEYEKVGRQAIQGIQTLESLLWLAALATLLLEALLIFRPLEIRVKGALEALEAKKSDLEKTIVELAAAEVELSASEEKFRAMAANVPGVVFQLVERRDGKRAFAYVSPRCQEIYGVSAEELERDWQALALHPEDQERFARTIREAFEHQTEWSFDGRVLTPDGDAKWCRGLSRPVAVSDDETVFNGVIIDITPQKEMEEKLLRLATTDPLTGAFNRRHFMVLAETERERARRHGHPLALLMLDIDHFKMVNDTHGHAGGDEALRRTVRTIRGQLRATDALGRFGGEEFCVLLPETGTEGACQLGERIRAAIADMRVTWEGREFGFTTSVGVACWDAADATMDDPLVRADRALYRAKTGGRNRVAFEPAGAAPAAAGA